MKEILNEFQKSINFLFNPNDLITIVGYDFIGRVTFSILSKVVKPRGLKNDVTINFFEAWCPNCGDKKITVN